jgi:hypothetical protein
VLEKDCAIRAREIHRLENELDETARYVYSVGERGDDVKPH